MKISGQYPKQPTNDTAVNKSQEKDAAQKAQLKGKPVSPASMGKENFTISKMKAKIDAEPDVNAARVKELKAQIKSGQYKVDTAKLAENLLKHSAIEDS